MTILDRLLSHDAWTTRQLLLACRGLSEEQLHHNFENGDRTLAETLEHIVAAMERHTDVLLQRPTMHDTLLRSNASVGSLLTRLTAVAKDFAEVSLKVDREGRADEMIEGQQEGKRVSLGGEIAHVLTHGMHHRAQAMDMMRHFGIDVIEGDVLSWEAVARGWGWDDGGSYGSMASELSPSPV